MKTFVVATDRGDAYLVRANCGQKAENLVRYSEYYNGNIKIVSVKRLDKILNEMPNNTPTMLLRGCAE